MKTEQFLFRNAIESDFEKIFDLYCLVSKTAGGLARTEGEITQDYIKSFIHKSLQNGVQWVIEDTLRNGRIIAEIHCYKLEPKAFGYVLSELTIAVETEYQGKGLGKKLFRTLLESIMKDKNDVFRVELIARESNKKAIAMYENLGFVREGKLNHRIVINSGGFEADIPMAWFNPNFKKQTIK